MVKPQSAMVISHPALALKAALCSMPLLGFDTRSWSQNAIDAGAKAAFVGGTTEDNDNLAAAVMLTPNTPAGPNDANFDSTETGESLTTSSGTINRTSWYYYTAASSGPVTITDSGQDNGSASGNEPSLQVFSGPTPGTQTYDNISASPIASNQNTTVGGTATVTFNAVAGTTYYIQQGTLTSEESGSDPYYTLTETVCFASGTLIRTDRGDVVVEELATGDLVVTASGAHRAIRWIGQRAYAARFANANPDLLPICVKAGALADGVPSRDLWVSPKHALFLDGVLIPAASLVNGVSIVKAERIEASLTYWHVELDSHDVILAENTPAESFVDDSGRGIFHNAHTFRELYPDAIEAEAVYCAPRVESGHILADVHRRLAERAGLVVGTAAEFGMLHGHVDLCDGITLRGWAQDELYPDAPVCLDVLVDGELTTMIYAEMYRSDLQAAGFGSGRHGFSLALPLVPEAAHTVEIRRSADGAALAGSPRFVARASARAA